MTFWRNYFFHCAFTRYEAGLSIDEIWSDEPPAAAAGAAGGGEATGNTASPTASAGATSAPSPTSNTNDTEETITFGKDAPNNTLAELAAQTYNSAADLVVGAAVAAAGATGSPAQQQRQQQQEDEVATNNNTTSIIDDASASATTATSGFEMVSESGAYSRGVVGDDDDDGDLAVSETESYELDELEAEIARELLED